MAASIEVDGRARLSASLLSAAGFLGDLGAANAEAAAGVAAAARVRAPVRTGRLRGSIHAAGTRSAGTVTATAVYARPIHYGWPARGITAQPYLDADTAGPGWPDPYAAHLALALERIHGA